MVVTAIYITRHGVSLALHSPLPVSPRSHPFKLLQFRVNWTLNPATGEYYTNINSPTNIPSDPPLAAYGVEQSHQLADALAIVSNPRISRVYSSPFYRCLQTIQPTVQKLDERDGGKLEISGDNGVGEWYGLARFTHPSPASPSILRSLFPAYSLCYTPSIIPSTSGESLPQLHDRCAYALSTIIANLDAETGPKDEIAIVICTHAASLIAMGRALTGRLPQDPNEEDFKPFTCGISKFVRREIRPNARPQEKVRKWEQGMEVPDVGWRGGRGVVGGWDCVMNGDCGHLEGGPERGW